MDRKSKIFFVVFFTVALIAVAVSFFKFFVQKDYYIRVEVSCSPDHEKCFTKENEKIGVSYYKLIEKKAYAITSELSCRPGEDCQEILCDQATKTSDQECSNSLTP